MIAFATCVGSEQTYRRHALAGLRLAAEPDSVVAETSTDCSIFAAYNEVLDALAELADLEALVLLHDDAEIVDPDFCAKLRARLADPDVAVIGVVGARGVRSLRWWEGQGFGAVRETRGPVDFGGGSHDVETVDGLLMVLSPWAVRNLRFDEQRFSGFHGYDADLCAQARAAGRRVIVDELDVIHHTKGGYGDGRAFLEADARWRAKWLADERPPAQSPCPLCAATLLSPPGDAPPTILSCPSCGIGVTLPPPGRDLASDGVFVEQYHGGRLEQRGQWLREAAVRLDWMAPQMPDGALVVDVGCATGELLAVAQERGLRPLGVELSLWAAEEARAFTGVEIFDRDLAEWPAAHPGVLADAACAFHVLEHVHDPVGFLRDMRALLRPGGHAFLEVPNYASAAAVRDPLAWVGTNLSDHVTHFTPETLAWALEQAGFRVLQTRSLSNEDYDLPAAWQRRVRDWQARGIARPDEDLLRAIAIA
ncbi:MAG: methyltransferase domain-containing protein [Actinobacteria bacterium]|nr:methyltransferase domain-containing protein [Actinomycetota bacterium]